MPRKFIFNVFMTNLISSMLQNQLSASTYLALIAQFLGDVEINLPEIDRIIPFETIQGIFATVNFAVKN